MEPALRGSRDNPRRACTALLYVCVSTLGLGMEIRFLRQHVSLLLLLRGQRDAVADTTLLFTLDYLFDAETT